LFAAAQSFAQTIPTTPYTFVGQLGTYSGVLVGGNPFGETNPVTNDVVLIPLIVQFIEKDGTIVTFDPTASQSQSCDLQGFSPLDRFILSPLVVPTDLKFNGIHVGKAQYIDGFMRAQFWNAPNHSRSSYHNELNWSLAPAPFVFPVALPSEIGIVNGTGCGKRGIVSKDVFNALIKDFVIPLLQASGVISPTQFAFFLTKNVVASANDPPTTQNIEGGQHYATPSLAIAGNPKQTWARAASSGDINTASHEIGEWMNDPFVNNPTPPWGFLGSFKNGCSSQFEVGDPLNGKKQKPYITLDSYTYHPQELAFFSWFFDAPGTTSFGTGGKFSGDGTFSHPSGGCPSAGN
jgi:hypothetical protein